MSEAETRSKISGGFSGLRWEAEECPDCKPGDSWKPTLFGGAAGWGVGLLFGMSPVGRLLIGVAGLMVGSYAPRYHFNVDWDPDRLRGEEPDAAEKKDK